MLPYEKKEREILVRQETIGRYGQPPEKRPLALQMQYAIVNIDKPKGPTSHQVSHYVQEILGLKKAGHSGTLDPAVTGVLPTALGKATRLVQALLPAGKEYIAVMHLHKEAKPDHIKQVCKQFTGKIRQMPPKKSAIKRQWRFRSVYELEILEIDGQDVLFRISCEAGTYIRKWIHDVGAKLGGAHMAQLRRIRAGPFTESTLITLQDLADAVHYHEKGQDALLRKCLLPVETAVEHLPKVWVVDEIIPKLIHGMDVFAENVAKTEDVEHDEHVAVMTLQGELIALGQATMTGKKMVKEEGTAVKIQKVFYQA